MCAKCVRNTKFLLGYISIGRNSWIGYFYIIDISESVIRVVHKLLFVRFYYTFLMPLLKVKYK